MDDPRGADLTGPSLPFRACFDIPKEWTKSSSDVIISVFTIINWRYEWCWVQLDRTGFFSGVC